MTERIDVFAHVLPPKFYQSMLKIDPQIPQKFPFINIKSLSDIGVRRANFDGATKQVISAVNINPEDFVDGEQAANLCRQANNEMATMITENADMFLAGIAMLPMNNIPAAIKIIDNLPANFVGVQVFTRANGRSIAAADYDPIFKTAANHHLLVLLHPIFDSRKPDNNLVFSWEYELSQAALELVETGLFDRYPNIKIIIHHAGAMIPFFAGRIDHILSAKQAAAFKKFYVDTALLRNAPSLQLAIDYFGANHVMFGTDAPFGESPAGATRTIIAALKQLNLPTDSQALINKANYQRLVAKIK